MEQRKETEVLKKIIQRRKGWLVLPFLATVLLCTLLAFFLPSIFRSSAIILIQYPQIPANLVPSTVTSYADQRIQAISQEVTARSKILQLVQKYNLIAGRRDRLSTEELVDLVRERIIIEPIDALIKKDVDRSVPLTIAFRLSYEDENPKRAQMVANEITSYYLQQNMEGREKRARSTTRFLEEQLRGAKTRLDELETKLAGYREAHLEELPEFSAVNLQKIEKLSSDITNLDMQIRSIEEQRAGMKVKLAETDPVLTSYDRRVITPEERLEQARMELAALMSRYSAQHPQVLAKKQEVALLENGAHKDSRYTPAREHLHELELKLATLKAKYTEEHPEIQSTRREIEKVKNEAESLESTGQSPRSLTRRTSNPAYIALKSELERTEVALASLKKEKPTLEKQIDEIREKLHAMPQVSKEYNELNTDYQNAKAHYSELQQKSMTAQVGQGMEEEQLDEAFQVMEPPFLPEKPVWPNRLAIIAIGIVVGAGLSFGGAFVREYSDDSIRDTRTLMELTGIPVFAVIPSIETEFDRSRLRRKRLIGMSIGLGALALIITSVHLFVMDINVLYAIVLQTVAKYLHI
jgi:uncharacterized protein involved in exopolysaccharide biosynthesis